MCGIVAAAASGNIVPMLIEGLKKLEYRGYDSAGLALLSPALTRLRSVGRVAELATQAEGMVAQCGIAHTRWATHGVPSERNAHPHVSTGLAVVHNGIIENYAEIKQELSVAGYVFSSDTDTEVIAHLLCETLKSVPDLFEAVRHASARLVGAYAIAVLQEGDDRVVVTRYGAPLLLGLGTDGNYAASDASALLQVTRHMIYLEEGDVAELRRDGIRIVGADGTAVERAVHESTLSADAVELGEYRHYMQKEIFEQPQALAATLEMIGGAHALSPNLFGVTAPELLADVKSVLIIACGTSYHAGLVARYWIEQIAGLPCTVEVASEYRYRVSVPHPQQLVVAISQSGETADTLASIRHAKSLGMGRTLAICNVPESAIVRECALRFLTRAGPEIGVASTKAFTTQLATLFLLAATLAKQAGRLAAEQEAGYLTALRHLPVAVQKVLTLEPEIAAWAGLFADKRHALFLGRGPHYPIALEGALKLKEISYIHAEAYPAGELKHGPLALVDKDMPVISVAPNDSLLEKLKSNLKEVAARGGELYVFADADSAVEAEPGLHVLRLPEHYGVLSPVLHVVPLQLLAYHAALVKGTDVDKPRNLAKSVTVE
ncbi:MAG: glutamine--fructose-6-phosphate transaminase (isomerizing) [Gammaproteobacteria bacterium]|nr:glutamine--fructose-6-phosphate transaminase (isomerizing) [Rhodocyclaceae bacterium]MBU3910737.1 glutamine--fructose-6-phosphate transaminase (isomerizing) [Gammaproteobacteria bacterium]MBU3988902.1 glutamine--fructose-6-phosphate transaminase (isomerizing) [Gammaproteobacteria bacterium]MBU4003447.1 glutamine--fructose-6-phosphate transaminase (isomerizing) [Gammaproteobacteria bacterium]MBU4021917.1 glutamine--fructose-6-phosphate transaminase (isomerizing) [Gammaproteobacteria bacterium